MDYIDAQKFTAMDTDLDFFIKYMEQQTSYWNNQAPKSAQKRTDASLEIIERCSELRRLLDEFTDL